MSRFDPTRTALVVVDVQNDFVAAGGACPRRHCDPEQLAEAIAGLIRAGRQQGRMIVWVSSAYGELGAAAGDLRGQTHTGAPCCVRGSWGAEVVARLQRVQDEGGARELHLRKRWYSSFRDTELQARLGEAGISTVVLCGVGTNTSVLATAREARGLGYAAEVLSDATTAGSLARHLAALREIEGLGGQTRRWGELLTEGPTPVQVTGVGAGETTLWCGRLRACISDDERTFVALEREVDWQAMLHRGGEVPRRVAIQGEHTDGAEPLYRHPVDEQPALRTFTPTVAAIRRAVEARVGHRLNHCLLQMYRSGRDFIREHSDKTLDVVRPSSIINVSLGRMRTMVLRAKRAPEGDARATQRLPLPHGSFLVMGLETNRDFYHAIRQVGDEGDEGARISLTFRNIGTFWDPRTGAVWGVGTPTVDRAEAEARARARAELSPEARAHAERDEAERLLRLFRDENQDPGFDASAYRPGFEILNFRSLLSEKT